MTSAEIRDRFLTFFEKRGHTILPSASLIPENDSSVLFNTAGMQPLVPYLLGQVHPAGTRLVDAQKCVRTVDIDDVGDNTHATFFEMMGNWSLGDYFKEDAIKWSYEFLTSKEEGLGLDPTRLYVTVFEGDENAPRDNEAAEIWKKYLPENKIYFLGAKDNWWSPGDNGPCGPDTEMFYDLTENGLGDLSHEEFVEANDSQRVVEIWNDVFMEYEKKDGKVIGKLAQKNVDTGSGLERITAVVQNKTNIFETDLFLEAIEYLQSRSQKTDSSAVRSQRIIADHIKAATFLIAEGVEPDNKDRGYIVRRLIRRAVRHRERLHLEAEDLNTVARIFIKQYQNAYPELEQNQEKIIISLKAEQEKSQKTLDGAAQYKIDLEMARDHKMIKRIKDAPIINDDGSASGFYIYENFQTYGLPPSISREIVQELGLHLNEDQLVEAKTAHQDLSRSNAGQKFKGGLADNSEETIKYHTATHLLNQALTDVLGGHVEQKGSNITPERLRFDFSHPEKLTEEQIKQVEMIVNQKIAEALPVEVITLPKEEALKIGARHVFLDKYGDEVTVYYIGNSLETAYSKEFCGGPHVKNTGELGQFKITKEEAVSAGVRRIKAILE